MNRLATAGQLSASIAHEINQPVTGIVLKASAALRWLAVEKPDRDKIRNVLTEIVAAGQRAGDIVNSVRAMFKEEETQKQRSISTTLSTRFSRCCASICKETASGSRPGWTNSFPPSPAIRSSCSR